MLLIECDESAGGGLMLRMQCFFLSFWPYRLIGASTRKVIIHCRYASMTSDLSWASARTNRLHNLVWRDVKLTGFVSTRSRRGKCSRFRACASISIRRQLSRHLHYYLPPCCRQQRIHYMNILYTPYKPPYLYFQGSMLHFMRFSREPLTLLRARLGEFSTPRSAEAQHIDASLHAAGML